MEIPMSRDKQVIDLTKLDLEDETTNLILNMSAGLLPENLSIDEVELLKKKYGEDWFTVLGYTEPQCKKP